MQRKIKVKVPATSGNLGPGFDVLGIALSLYNELEMTLIPKNKKDRAGSVEFKIFGEGKDSLPRDEKNIIWQSAKKVFNRARFPLEKYNFKFQSLNRIPLSRGLGSSSAAILGGLLAANALLVNALDERDILSLASESEGHPDNVVPALVGGLTVAENGNKKISYIRLDPPGDLRAVVCVPEYELSTVKARSVLPKAVSFQDALFNIKRVSRFLSAIQSKNYEHLREAMEDKLHQPYRKKLVPGFDRVLEKGYQGGALGVALSGAGPSIFAFAKENNSAKVARNMEKGFLSAGYRSKSLVLELNKKGSIVI